MLRSAGRNGLLLTLFAIATTGLIALTHQLTKERIADAKRAQQYASLTRLLPAGSYDNDLAASCVQLAADPRLGPGDHQAFIARKEQLTSAIALQVTAPDGYSGSIELLVAIDRDGVLTGVEVLGHKETPGLGDKIERRRSSWLDSFVGRRLERDPDPRFAVKKDGGDFDQFTGATITPRAVVGAVANALRYHAEQAPLLANRQPDCGDQP
ncbi:MAG: electron transport complex subunit RsxG [Corallincola sp.]|nr:electron transport complex subunit RsxG [Corallincola sp.]